MQLISQNGYRWFNHIIGLVSFCYRLVLTITQPFQDSRLVLHASGKLRRFWLVHFRTGYVQRQISLRRGACRQCGACCTLLFTCPMLTKQERCLVYDTCRPQTCRDFPIDQRDINEVQLCGVQCGYRFNREDSDKVRKIGRS